MVECKNESQKIPEGISNIEVDEEVDAILVIESSSAYSKLFVDGVDKFCIDAGFNPH